MLLTQEDISIEVGVPVVRTTQAEEPIEEKLDNYCQELAKDKDLKFLYAYLFHREEPDPVDLKLSSPATRFYGQTGTGFSLPTIASTCKERKRLTC